MTRKIAVIGAGVMGRGIIQVLVRAGYDVAIFDIFGAIPGLREKAAQDIWNGFFAAKGGDGKSLFKSNEELRKTFERLEWYDSAKEENFLELQDCEAVIEAIKEDFSEKQKLYDLIEFCANEGRKGEKRIKIFTNTSTLKISELAKALRYHPENFMGTHFFNPVPDQKLVELIPHYGTSAGTVGYAKSLIRELGKEMKLALDTPGFEVNGVLLPMLAVTMEEVEKGTPIEVIDKAFTSGIWGELPAARKAVEAVIVAAEDLIEKGKMQNLVEVTEEGLDNLLRLSIRFPRGPFELKKALEGGVTKDIKFKMGPGQITDLVGVDVAVFCFDMLRLQEPNWWNTPKVLERMVAEGKLGMKSGEGFYRYEKVLSEVVSIPESGERYARLSWPGKFLSVAVVEQFMKAFEELRSISDLKAVVVEINRCRGANVLEFPGVFMDKDQKLLESVIRKGQNLMRTISEFPVPVIPVIRGTAWGGGYELALAGDYIVAEKGAKIGLPELKLGILPGWGGTQNLVRRVGYANALSMILGAAVIEASRPWVQSVVDKVDDAMIQNLIQFGNLKKRDCRPLPYPAGDDDEIRIVNERRAQWKPNPPASFELAYRAVLEGNRFELPEGLEIELEAIKRAFRTKDAEDGIRSLSFFENRDPQFKGK